MKTHVNENKLGVNQFALFDLLGEDRKKPKPEKEEALPEFYTDRKFYQGSGVYAYFVNALPGNVVKLDPISKTFSIATLTGYATTPPPVKILENAVIYSSKVDSGFSFNGSVVLGGFEVSEEEAMEIIIKDDVACLLENSMIDVPNLTAFAQNLGNLDNYFFIKGCVLSSVTAKKYRKQKFSAKINASFLTMGGETYSSNEKFSSQSLLSMEIVPLSVVVLPTLKV
jgi:hypothetical protein